MKKIILTGLCLIFSQITLAENLGIVSYKTGYFPTAGIDYYSRSEYFLVKEANKFCDQTSERVDKISNINIQIHGDFVLNNGTSSDPNKTSAITYPLAIYTALVSCKGGKL